MEVRPGYKQTEVGVFPEEWEVARLGEISRIIRGASPRPKGDKRFYGGPVPRLMVEDVTRDGKIVIPQVDSLTAEGAKRSRPCRRGTLTLVCSGTVGIPSFLGVDACIHDGFLAVVGIRPDVSSDYLYYQFDRLRLTFESSATHGGVFTNLTTKGVREFVVPIPSSDVEQRAIASALSDVDALLGGLERLIAKKRDLKQAAMQQLLTGQTRLPGFSGEWEVKRLGELLAYEQPTKYLVRNSEYSDVNDVPVLTAGKTFILGYSYEVDGIFNNLPVIIFDDFTTAIKYVTFPFKAKSSAMKLLTPRNPSVNLRLIYEIMQLIEFQLSEHKRYWISEYQKLEIKLPDEKEQTAIATVLSDMDAELSALVSRRDKTRDLKQAMMQELLTGRTRLV